MLYFSIYACHLQVKWDSKFKKDLHFTEGFGGLFKSKTVTNTSMKDSWYIETAFFIIQDTQILIN